MRNEEYGFTELEDLYGITNLVLHTRTGAPDQESTNSSENLGCSSMGQARTRPLQRR